MNDEGGDNEDDGHDHSNVNDNHDNCRRAST